MTEWLPIETAPRDGTIIDVWVRSFTVGEAGKLSVSEGERRAVVKWDREVHHYANPYERREGEVGWVHSVSALDWELIERGDSRVTHWMPLPEPPEDKR